MSKGTFIDFIQKPVPTGQITRRWMVINKQHGSALGMVKWHAHWRKYGFFPEAGCVFEETCLRDIAAFIEERTAAHKGTNGA